MSNLKNGDNLTIIRFHSFTFQFKKFILFSSAENGPQIVHYFSCAAYSGKGCDEH